MRDPRSQGDIWDISWCHMLELMMAKACPKTNMINKKKIFYTFELQKRFKIKLLFTEYLNNAVPKLERKKFTPNNKF